MKTSNAYQVISVAFFFVLLGVGLFSYTNKQPAQDVETHVGVEDLFDNKKLSSKAVLILDDSTNSVLYQKNAEEQFEIASIVKIMTALIAMEELRGKTIVIDRGSYNSVGDTGLLIEEKWDTEDLIMFMMSNSSNDAAEALARSYPLGREAFIERMNTRARELDINVVYHNPTGLTEYGESGGVGTAGDVARLISYAYKKYPTIFEYTTKNGGVVSSNDAVHTLENTNLIASSIAGLQASKTGYTDKSGGALALRINMGLDNPYIFVILGSENRGARFLDIEYLISKTREYLNKN